MNLPLNKKIKTISSYGIISSIITSRYFGISIPKEKAQIIEALAIRRYCLMKNGWLKKHGHEYGSDVEQGYCENFPDTYFETLIEHAETITEKNLKIIYDFSNPSNDNIQKSSWFSELSQFLLEHKLIISLFFIFLSVLCIGIFPSLQTTIENCFKYTIDKIL